MHARCSNRIDNKPAKKIHTTYNTVRTRPIIHTDTQPNTHTDKKILIQVHIKYTERKKKKKKHDRYNIKNQTLTVQHNGNTT